MMVAITFAFGLVALTIAFHYWVLLWFSAHNLVCLLHVYRYGETLALGDNLS